MKTKPTTPLTMALCAAGLSALAATHTHATPLLFGTHYYDYIQVTDPYTGTNNAWATDNAAANASVFNTLHGHLATVGSQAENDFLFSLVPTGFTGFEGAWLGGKSPEGWLAGPENGQAFAYTNWGGIEPNNGGYTYMNIGASFAGINPGKWADDSGVQGVPTPGNDPVIGYFVEYEAPEPSSAALLLGSGLLLLRRRRGE